MSAQIIFRTSVPTFELPDQFYIFKADISPSEEYANVGNQVYEAAKNNVFDIEYLGAIQKLGLDLKAKLNDLWLIFKDESNTAASTYAIVADLNVELDLIDPSQLGVMGSLINADIKLKLKRIVYSHNLSPNLMGRSHDDIIQEIPQLYWPDEFDAGIYGEFVLCIGDKEIPFRSVYSVYKFDKWGNVVPNPAKTGEPENENPTETENADNKGGERY